MKKLLSILFLLFSFITYSQQKDVWVNGYYRSDGTYVNGHYRTTPNKTINDNYSTEGNINPYTGQEGTVPRENTYKPKTIKSTQAYRNTTRNYNSSTTSYPKQKTMNKTKKATNSYIY